MWMSVQSGTAKNLLPKQLRLKTKEYTATRLKKSYS